MSNSNVSYGSSTTVLTGPGFEQVTIQRPIRKENFYPFSMVGLISKGTKEMDIFDRLFSTSKSAIRIFLDIKNRCSNDYNLATIPELSGLKDNQKRAFRRCIAELKKVDLVARARSKGTEFKVPKNTYMINPYYLKCLNYSEAQMIWSQYTL